MRVVLIPCAPSEWRLEGRLLGRVGLDPSATADAICSGWARRVGATGVGRIWHAPDDLSATAATVVSRELGLPAKAYDDLAEVDLGLWAGLTDASLKTRFATPYRELNEAPTNVTPPGGENLGHAAERLMGRLGKAKPTRPEETLGLTLRPIALALVLLRLGAIEPSGVWTASQVDELVLVRTEGSGEPRVERL